MTTKTITMRLGINDVMCDPRTNVLHTGSWSQWRNGARGRWPKKSEFITDCGQQLQVIPHKCAHEYIECEDCKSKNS